MTLDDLCGHTSFNENWRLHNVDILEMFLKDIAEKDDFEIFR